MKGCWVKKACWQKWISEEQASLYSLAFFFTRDEEAALRLTQEAVILAYRAGEDGFSKAMFLRAVADQICQLHKKYSQPAQSKGEPAQVMSALLHMEGELRLLVLFYCVLQFDRQSLAVKLEWPQERVNRKLNQALAMVNRSFLRQQLLVTQPT